MFSWALLRCMKERGLSSNPKTGRDARSDRRRISRFGFLVIAHSGNRFCLRCWRISASQAILGCCRRRLPTTVDPQRPKCSISTFALRLGRVNRRLSSGRQRINDFANIIGRIGGWIWSGIISFEGHLGYLKRESDNPDTGYLRIVN